MARGMGTLRPKLLSVAVLALLGAAGCGQVNVTENAVPSSSSPGGGVGTTPNNPPANNPSTPGTPSTPGGGSNPGTLNPPTQAIGDPATATANGAVLTNTRTDVYNLNPNAVGQGSWQNTGLLDAPGGFAAEGTQVALDAAGNGFAIWKYRNTGSGTSSVYVARYTASTAGWSAGLRLDSLGTNTYEPRIAVDRQSGNAIATWVQGATGATLQYMRQYDAATGTWGAIQLLGNPNNEVVTSESTSVAINGSHAAITFRQKTGPGSAGLADIYLTRLVGGTWTTPVVVDPSPEDAKRAEIAVDPNGNVMITWRQMDGEFRIHARRWNNTTQAFGPVIQLDNEGDRQPRVGMDAAGNAFVLWRQGGVYVRRYDVTTGTWGPQLTLDNQTVGPSTGELSVDPAGNAIAAWIQGTGTATEVYTARYSASTSVWSPAELMETSNLEANPDKNPTVSLSGNNAVVAWTQKANGRDNVHARELSDGVWGSVQLLANDPNSNADYLSSAINVAGNSVVVWSQAEAYQARYQSSNFVVPSGATWQSVANTLYGVNSVEGGNALQAALGGIALTPGAVLTGLPATLSVTTTIPPYYTVLATDTWSHIARTVYGVTDVNAIAQLRSLLGNPTLSAGLQLVVPSTYNFVTSGSYSAPLNWALVNTTTTTYHNIVSSALTTPLNSWSADQVLEFQGAEASSARIAYDANSNGIAVWAQGNDLMMSRYVATTATWSTPVALDDNANEAHNARLAIDRTSGDAIVSWSQSDGTAESRYVSSFDSSTNAWSTPALLETAAGEVSMMSEQSEAAMAGDYAAVVWVQGTGTENNVYLSRRVAGTWTAPTLLDSSSEEPVQVDVGADANGNVTVIWQQDVGGTNQILVRRWNNAAQTLGAETAINAEGDRQPQIAFDAQGNGFALWGSGAYVRRFDVVTGQWGAQVRLPATEFAANGGIAVDATGNALAAWVELEADGVTWSAYARYFDVTTQSWGAAASLENSANNVSTEKYLSVSLVNGSGVVAWIQEDLIQAEIETNVYAARFANGVWGSATLLDSADFRADEVTSAMDADNNATVVWIQGTSVYHSVSDATPYYLVPAGATWRSIAATLYNVDSDAAGQALQTAMGSPTLSTGLHLQGPPVTLAVSPQVPTHYIVQNGDTWASITLALYGTNATQAAAALQTALSNPPLTVGTLLYIPSELNYSVPDA